MIKRLIYIFVFVLIQITFLSEARSQSQELDNLLTSDYLEDKQGSLNINDIISSNYSDKFIKSDKSTYNFGFTKSVYWVRFKINLIQNVNNKLLEIAYPPLDEIELYIPHDTSFEIVKGGDSLTFSSRKIKHRNFIFEIPLKTGFYYLRVRSEGSVTIPIKVYEFEHFWYKESTENFIFGLYYGIVLAIFLYNFILYFYLKENNYLYYALYVLGYGIFQMSINGMAYQLLWPDSPFINTLSIPFFGSIALFWMMQFSKSFLALQEHNLTLNKTIKYFLYIISAETIATIFLSYSFSVIFLVIVSFISVLLITFSAFNSAKHGVKAAKSFLIGWFLFLMAILVYSLKTLGFLPDNVFTAYGIQTGSALQMILISLAIAERINNIKIETEKAQNNALASQKLALESLKKSDIMKDEFLANTSHELKTPLNGIIGIAESLIDGISGKLPEIAIQNLLIIIYSGKRLSNLVNDILDFSKLKNQEIYLNQRTIDIKQITDIVFVILKNTIKGKNIELVNDITSEISLVYADEERLEQVFYNLIGNAIKFTEKGVVSISSRRANEFVEVIVSDTGIGIPENKINDIFKAFEQVDSSISRKYGGTGIGLTITKQLIELHGGTIRVESKEGVGSHFIFTVPVSNETAEKNNSIDTDFISKLNYESVKEEQSSSEKELVTQENKIHILIVDDEPVNLQVLINHLSLQNYFITQAADGPSALKAIQNAKPDLVLLDIMMPGMSGYEVCKKVRETYHINELPIVMLTAKNRLNDLIEGFDSGANDYLTKPVSKNELLARIRTHSRLAKINSSYNRFVPHEFINFMNRESILDVRLGDQVQKEMTIMFSDIRSFTTISEKMSPEENFNFINSYLSRVSPAIRKNKGFIDKYIGDGIMALFPEKPEQAIEAAIAMIKELDVFNIYLESCGLEKINIGIGLHTGSLMLGTVGEHERMESTVISDAVNLASRLEGLTKVYGASIIVSEDTLNIIEKNNYKYRFLGLSNVKGKAKMINIFEIYEADDPEIIRLKTETKDIFEEAIMLYQDKKITEAIGKFNQVLEVNKNDHTAILYWQRCMELIL